MLELLCSEFLHGRLPLNDFSQNCNFSWPQAFTMYFSYLHSHFSQTHLYQIYDIPQSLVGRWGHSINAVGVRDNCVWVMITGRCFGPFRDANIILFELSEWHNVITSKQTLISKDILLILTGTYHVLLVLLFSSDTRMQHVHTCIYSLPLTVTTISICYIFSHLRTRFHWLLECHLR